MSKGFVLVFITLLVLGGFSFYWYSYHPAQIRSQCLAEAEFTPTATLMVDEEKRQGFIDKYYQNCIRRFGLRN